MKLRVNVQTILGGNYIPQGAHFDILGTEVRQVEEGCHCNGSHKMVNKNHYQISVNGELYWITEDFVTVIPVSDSNMLEPGSPQDRIDDRNATTRVMPNFKPGEMWERAKLMSIIDLRKRK